MVDRYDQDIYIVN